MINKRDFIFHGSCFCEKYSTIYNVVDIAHVVEELRKVHTDYPYLAWGVVAMETMLLLTLIGRVTIPRKS